MIKFFLITAILISASYTLACPQLNAKLNCYDQVTNELIFTLKVETSTKRGALTTYNIQQGSGKASIYNLTNGSWSVDKNDDNLGLYSLTCANNNISVNFLKPKVNSLDYSLEKLTLLSTSNGINLSSSSKHFVGSEVLTSSHFMKCE